MAGEWHLRIFIVCSYVYGIQRYRYAGNSGSLAIEEFGEETKVGLEQSLLPKSFEGHILGGMSKALDSGEAVGIQDVEEEELLSFLSQALLGFLRTSEEQGVEHVIVGVDISTDSASLASDGDCCREVLELVICTCSMRMI